MRDKGYWHNFDTGEFELASFPATDEDALPYLPVGPARGLYSCHRVLGKSIGEAMKLTLTRCVGENDEK